MGTAFESSQPRTLSDHHLLILLSIRKKKTWMNFNNPLQGGPQKPVKQMGVKWGPYIMAEKKWVDLWF